MMTFGSLFAGIGGFDLGLERAGMVCKWQVEREPYAVRVLEKHWPEVTRHDDVCTFPPEQGNWEVDLICGGFPCQDISVAGKGAGLAGERSGLWHEMHRIVSELRPRWVIVENVAALLSRGMETVLGDLSQIGYDAEWQVIPASAVGAPHRRDRVWIVANAVSKRDAVRRDGTSVPPAVACRGRDARGSVGDCGAGCSQEPRKGACDVADANSIDRRLRKSESKRAKVIDRSKTGNSGCDAADASGSRLEGQRQVSFGIGSKLENTGNSCWWETEPAVDRVVDGLPHRMDRLRGLGNAVVPQIVEFIGRRILETEAAR